jgi:hypothetical protein
MVRVHVNNHGRNGPNNSASLSVGSHHFLAQKKYVEKLLPPDRDQDDKFRQLLGLLDKQPAFPLHRR